MGTNGTDEKDLQIIRLKLTIAAIVLFLLFLAGNWWKTSACDDRDKRVDAYVENRLALSFAPVPTLDMRLELIEEAQREIPDPPLCGIMDNDE